MNGIIPTIKKLLGAGLPATIFINNAKTNTINPTPRYNSNIV